LFIEEYIFEIEIGDKRYPMRDLLTTLISDNVSLPISRANIYLGISLWAECSIDIYGAVLIENQALKIPIGGLLDLDMFGGIKLELKNVSIGASGKKV
jgi:hypothetical protein